MTAMIDISNAEKTFTMHLQGGVQLPFLREGATPGRKITFGIRPEHIYLRTRENTGRVPSTIEVVEPLGHRTILTARCAAGVLQLEAEAMPGLKPGDAADLFFDLPRAHLFDQATECVL